jgi:hypothetical protein
MLPISVGLVRWQPKRNVKKKALYRLYGTKSFTICDQHFQTLGMQMSFKSCLFVKIRYNNL